MSEAQCPFDPPCWWCTHPDARMGRPADPHVTGFEITPVPAALLLDRAESYQRDAGVIGQSGRHAEAVAYETVAAELRKVAEEVGR